jgi:amino acid transporter
MLRRRLTLLQAVSLNMAMMVGIGPFITLPDLVSAARGPHAVWIWVLGAIIAIADGLVWSELAAAFPGSGGTYHFFDAIYGSSQVGRLLKFLFVWQFLFSGPLELASGSIGFGKYAQFALPWLREIAWRIPLGGGLVWEVHRYQLLGVLVMAAVVVLAYRQIEVAGRTMVALWVGVIITLGWMIVAGFTQFHPELALSSAVEPPRLDADAAWRIGQALLLAMYCYLGYYQICYLGDEIADPARTIPKSILISTLSVGAIYVALNVSVLGVLPWQEVAKSPHVASDFMLQRYGNTAAHAITLLILWTGATGTFAGVLGYARIPYAAARSGHFFRSLAKTHPTKDFPHRSLLLIGVVSTITCLADLDLVIQALFTSRILIQFVGQVFTLFYVRLRPELASRLRFRMWLYPMPALVSLVGWLYIFGTTSRGIIVYGLASLAAGLIAFWIWDRRTAPTKDAPIGGDLA